MQPPHFLKHAALYIYPQMVVFAWQCSGSLPGGLVEGLWGEGCAHA